MGIISLTDKTTRNFSVFCLSKTTTLHSRTNFLKFLFFRFLFSKFQVLPKVQPGHIFTLFTYFHCPAFSAPFPKASAPSFTPPVRPCSPFPTALVPVVSTVPCRLALTFLYFISFYFLGGVLEDKLTINRLTETLSDTSDSSSGSFDDSSGEISEGGG